MKNIVIVFLFVFSSVLKAQDSTEVVVDKPVKNTFIASNLIYQQTVSTPAQGAFEMVYVHRFGPLENGTKSLYGIYSGAKVLMSLSYGITDRIMIGFASTSGKLQHFNYKIALLKQTKANAVPVSVSLYGNMGIDTRDEAAYTDVYTSYKFAHRLSYFTQLMIARKFGTIASLQVAPYLAYYNAVEKDFTNANLGTSVSGRVKIYNNIAFIADYNQPFNKATFDVKPGISGGFEVGTATHSFQLFISNLPYIVQQRNAVYNEFSASDFSSYCLGFNLTVRL